MSRLSERAAVVALVAGQVYGGMYAGQGGPEGIDVLEAIAAAEGIVDEAAQRHPVEGDE